MSKLSDHPLIVGIGAISAVISIFVFTTGIPDVKALLNSKANNIDSISFNLSDSASYKHNEPYPFKTISDTNATLELNATKFLHPELDSSTILFDYDHYKNDLSKRYPQYYGFDMGAISYNTYNNVFFKMSLTIPDSFYFVYGSTRVWTRKLSEDEKGLWTGTIKNILFGNLFITGLSNNMYDCELRVNVCEDDRFEDVEGFFQNRLQTLRMAEFISVFGKEKLDREIDTTFSKKKYGEREFIFWDENSPKAEEFKQVYITKIREYFLIITIKGTSTRSFQKIKQTLNKVNFYY